MQLVAYGAQDIYLTGNPQITYFKVIYRRHTNFSIESIKQIFSGISASGVGGKVIANISRNGDLLYKTYLVLNGNGTKLKPGKISSNYGHNVIDYVEVEIGGHTIDKHYGHFMETWSELTEPNPTKNVAHLDTIHFSKYKLANYPYGGGTSGSIKTNYFTKFQAMACAGGINASMERHGDGILVSATFITHNLHIPLRFWFCKDPGLALPLISLQYHEVNIIVNFSAALQSTSQHLWCDYIYLDIDERRRFAQVSHEYLIEQVQLNTFTQQKGESTYNLNFNHPVKELIWVYLEKDWNKTKNSITYNSLCSYASIEISGDLDSPNMTLKLNGHDRFEKRPVSYFTRAQTYQYHTGTGLDSYLTTESTSELDETIDTIAVYSFCLKPEEHQPSGTCNFSRIDSSQLITDDTIGNSNSEGNIQIYAINYNILRIMSGMGGLAYSN